MFKKIVTRVLTGATILSTAMATFAVAPATISAQDDGDTVRIGSLYELSGAVAAYGQTQSKAISMAVAEINEAGGIDGKQIEVVEFDTKSDDTEAAVLATRLASTENVSVIIGPATTSQMQAAIPIVNEFEVPLIAPSVTDTNIVFDDEGNVHPFAYRTSWPNSFQGAGIGKFAYENLEAEKTVVIYDNSSDYGVGLYENFKDNYEGEIVTVETVQPSDSDFSAVVTNLMAEEFDAITILAFYQTAGPLVKQIREMGFEQPIIGSNGFGNDIIYELALPENMNDVYYASLYPILEDDEFVKKYQAEFGSNPDMFAALAYDTVYMVKQAIEQAGSTDPVAVNEALENLGSFEGITGSFIFDENHNPTKNVVNLIEIQDAEEVGVHEVVFD